MISSSTNFTQITRNTSTLPITPAEIRAVAQYFSGNRDDTSFDAEITSLILQAVFNWERETKFLIFDQTFKAFLYDQLSITHNFSGRLPVMNVYSFDAIKYYPCDWNYTDAKITLDPSLYYFMPEVGTDSAQFKLRNGYLEVFEVYNNIEFNGKGGYQNNIFTNLPLEIKRALILMTADDFDAIKGLCGCNGAYYSEVKAIYNQKTACNFSFTL